MDHYKTQITRNTISFVEKKNNDKRTEIFHLAAWLTLTGSWTMPKPRFRSIPKPPRTHDIGSSGTKNGRSSRPYGLEYQNMLHVKLLRRIFRWFWDFFVGRIYVPMTFLGNKIIVKVTFWNHDDFEAIGNLFSGKNYIFISNKCVQCL